MARIPTYILAPNFTLHDTPGSPYYPWLGNIIADPLNPTTRILSKLADGPSSGIVSVQEDDNTYIRGSGKSINASLWANFMQIASASLHGQKAEDKATRYRMTRGVETRYFEPSDEEVAQRIAESAKVRAAMNAGLFGRQPVYMVTGIKIAKGFEMEASTESGVAWAVGAGAPVTPEAELSVGVDLGGTRHRSKQTSFRTAEGTDVIFAYQVHVIATKGWREHNKGVEARVYLSKYAFLGKEEEDANVAIEAKAITKEDVEMDEPGVSRMQLVELGDESGERCLCIIPQGQSN